VLGGSAILAVALLAASDGVRADDWQPDDPLPAIEAPAIGQGWTLDSCTPAPDSWSCLYSGPGASAMGIFAHPLAPTEYPAIWVDIYRQSSCDSAKPFDVGNRADTAGCIVPASDELGSRIDLVFANQSWLFSVVLLPGSAGVTTHDTELALHVRTVQLALVGGEPAAPDHASSVPPDASDLDPYLPSAGPAGFLPSNGITTDLDTFNEQTLGDLMSANERAFLSDHTTARVRLWMAAASDGGVAVIVTHYPFAELAGLALGALEDGDAGGAPIEAPGAAEIADLVSIETPLVSGDGHFTIEAFRRGRLAFQIAAFGGDSSRREELASSMATAVAGLAPGGPSAPLRPPGVARSLGQAALATALVVAAALGLRRLAAGRAARPAPIEPPAPRVLDVSAAAARLRREGRRLAAVQIVGCAVVVVGLIADVGWWWVPVVILGALIGLGATAAARRRERARMRSRWTTPRPRTTAIGLAGAALLVLGVALSVRGLKEWVLLPSLTHLRLADRAGTTPHLLAAALGLAGIVLLVLAAALLRRARAHARADRRRATRTTSGEEILYLRSFGDDRLSVPSVHSARRPFFELFGRRGRDPFEEGIAWELAAQGELCAIGRPGESTLTLGATRDLVDQATWQSNVTARMATARWIVLAIGATGGLEWEVDALARQGHLARTVFVVPPVAVDEVEARWMATRHALDQAHGQLFVAPVHVAGTVTIRVDPRNGEVSATRADRLDEAGYRAAIEYESSSLLAGATSTRVPVPTVTS
jgi:hypothetical protein